MKKVVEIGFLLVMLTGSAFAQGAFLDKMSLNIHLRSHRGQAEWRWTPKISFDLKGKLSGASKITVEIISPNGKPFVKLECTPNTRDDDWQTIADCGNDLEAASASTLTGVHGFQIKMGDAVLYSGKFTVAKYLYNPAKNPAFNKNFYYYIDYDWRLPVAFVGSWKDEYTPTRLTAWVWIKGDQSEPQAVAQLIYQGKTVAETSFGTDMTYGAEENDAVAFSRLRFRFNALLEKPDSESYHSWWKVYENPGEYEIRALRRGVLARIFKFTIGKDGKPLESGIGKEIKEGYEMVVVPVKTEGASDGTLNQTLLKSGWWSNPISGLNP